MNQNQNQQNQNPKTSTRKWVSELSATGLTNADFQHRLDPITVFTGPNTVGKTSRLRAIQLALLGYCPDVGKTSPATMSMARHDLLDVRVDLSDGEFVHRKWARVDGAVKTLAWPGPEWTFPDVLLDPGVYFALPPKQRTRYVFERVRLPDISGEHVISQLRERVTARTPMIENLLKRLDDSDTERHEVEQSVQDWLRSTIDTLKSELKAARDEERQCSVITTDNRPTTLVLPDISEKLREKREKLEAMVSALSGIQAKASEIESTNNVRNKAIGRLTADIARVEESMLRDIECPHCPTCGADSKGWQAKIVAKHNTRIAELKADYDRIASEPHLDPAEYRHEANTLSSAIALVRTEVADLEGQYRQFIANTEARSKRKSAEDRLLNATLSTMSLKPIISCLETIQEQMVSSAFAHLEKTANDIWRPVFGGALSYKDGEIGRMQDSVWIPHDTFSGSEKAVCYLAMSAALAQSAPCRLVLMDELGRFTRETLERLFFAVDSAIMNGIIDQFVGCGTAIHLPKYATEIKLDGR